MFDPDASPLTKPSIVRLSTKTLVGAHTVHLIFAHDKPAACSKDGTSTVPLRETVCTVIHAVSRGEDLAVRDSCARAFQLHSFIHAERCLYIRGNKLASCLPCLQNIGIKAWNPRLRHERPAICIWKDDHATSLFHMECMRAKAWTPLWARASGAWGGVGWGVAWRASEGTFVRAMDCVHLEDD